MSPVKVISRGLKLSHLDVVEAAIRVVGVSFAIYQIISVVVLLQPFSAHLNTHLTFALTLIFLSLMRKSKRQQPILWLLLLLALISTGYLRFFHDELILRMGFPNTLDLVMGILLIGVIFEANRRGFGLPLCILLVGVVIYVYFGHYLSGPFHLANFSIEEMATKAFMIPGAGIFGTPLSISAKYIFLFVLFASILNATGSTRAIMVLGKLAGRHIRSGPAMTAILTSSLIGTSVGSASANIAITGSFTIPLMKKFGYTPDQAGAIECAASNGGQLMPPVMGAVAFLMAAYTGVSYLTVIVIAIVPALLYYASIALYVQLQAVKAGLGAGQSGVNDVIDYRDVIVFGPAFLIPLIVIVTILIMGYTPMYAAALGIISSILISLARKETRISLKQWVQALTEGAIIGAQISTTLAIIGMIVSFLVMSGFGFIMSKVVVSVAAISAPLALIFTAVLSIILGMGVPTTGAYIIVATLIAPTLVRLGTPLLSAHFFVFYFAIVALVTPPVAPAAVQAAAMSGGSFWKTGIEAFKVSSAAFLIPFLMVWAPIVMLIWTGIPSLIAAIVTIPVMILGLQVTLVGQYILLCNWAHRLLAGASCGLLVLFWPTGNYTALFVGLGLFAFLTWWQLREKHRLEKEADE